MIILTAAMSLLAAACSGSGDSQDAAPAETAADADIVVELGGGATINTANCPADWDNYAGVTDDEIRIGVSLPFTGALALYGVSTDAQQFYFDAVGPIEGKRVVIVARDDAYDANRHVFNVGQMLASENILGFSGNVGTPTNLAARPILNEMCVPQLLTTSGSPVLGDPANYPWTIGGRISHKTETNVWCRHFVDELGQGATVSMLYMDNAFGTSFRKEFNSCVVDSGLDVIAVVAHDPLAEDISAEVSTLAASDADILAMATAGRFCAQALDKLSEFDWSPTKVVINSCQNAALYLDPLGSKADGVRSVLTIKDVLDPALADDEWVQFVNGLIDEAGVDPRAGDYSIGFRFAEILHQMLLDAAAMDGGVNRTNLMAAAWSLDFDPRAAIDGMLHKTDGANDAYLIEGGQMAEYTFDPQAGSGNFHPIGVIDVEGQAGSYAP